MGAASEPAQRSAGRPAAVLWDMDGTLVDTEPYWMEVERDLVEQHGGTWTREHALALVGNDLITSGEYIRDHGGVDLTPAEIVEVLLDGVVERIKQSVPWRPGALDLLRDLRASGVPCGLVTMSYERFVTPVLDVMPPGSFDVVVTGDAVTRGKPHPEPYLHAARLLGVRPSDCVAIEDSGVGARSAEAAGCLVVVVENHVPVEPGERRIFLETLSGTSTETLSSLALHHP